MAFRKPKLSMKLTLSVGRNTFFSAAFFSSSYFKKKESGEPKKERKNFVPRRKTKNEPRNVFCDHLLL